jgi:hypothetical protein
MRPFHEISLILDERQLLRRFWQAASVFWRVQTGRTAMLAMFLIAVVLLQLLVQVALNLWNRHFFDALERKDAATVWLQAQLFVPLAVGSILLAAASVWGRMTAQRSWREALTRHVIEKWTVKDRFRHLNHLAKGSENPEYRISADVRIATDAPIDLSLAFFSSIVTALTFFGVLWTIGGSIDVTVFGRPVTIPGYLVFGVILYSGMVTSLMIIFGHHLTSVIERSNQAEAEFRAAADTFHQEPAARTSTRSIGVKHAAQAAGGPALVARILLAARSYDARVARKFPFCPGSRLDVVRPEISQRRHVTGRADAGGGSFRCRPGSLQLARRQLPASGRLALVRSTRCNLVACT